MITYNNGIREQWKPIKGFEHLYGISNLGEIESYEREVPANNRFGNYNYPIKSKKIGSTNKRYNSVCLFKDGKRYWRNIHRLVAEHFVPNPHNKPQVNHIDGNKHNNKYTNLEWVTAQENMRHAKEVLGIVKGYKGRYEKTS